MSRAPLIKEKRITTNELAAMVQRGFAAVDSRFESLESTMNRRFDDVDRRFEDMQAQIDGIYVNYATMNEHQLLASRVSVLEKRARIKAV